MIIVRLLGGLGNQLFQYAAARRLAVEKATTLKLDVTAFSTYTLRSLKLHHFNISADIATPDEIKYFTNPNFAGKLTRWFERRFLPRSRRRVYKERKRYQFEPDFLRTPDEVYLEGYFQNEGYFGAIASLIRREFTLKTPPDAANAAVAEHISSVNAVSLHIRRGDYAANPDTQAYHGLLPIDYYQAAIQRIAERIAQPHFFIFSDDPNWALAHLKLAYPTDFINHNNSDQDYEDLRLLSLCKHHIIANSSFSWWGAWLSAQPDKIIYAPARWLLASSVNTSNLLPPSWIQIPIQGK